MDAQKLILVAVIVALFAALALELKYIEETLIGASLPADEQCDGLCSEKGLVPYMSEDSCFCKEPISFRRELRCLWNVTFVDDPALSPKFNASAVRENAVASVVDYMAPNSQATKVFGIFNAVSSRISYVSDPRKDEYVASPAETWASRGGDCDDFSILLASMYESVGLDAGIAEVYNTTYGHVFTLVRIDQDPDSFLDVYKALLERHTPYFSEKPFHLIVLGRSRSECDAIEDSFRSGGNIGEFYLAADGTYDDYPGSYDAFGSFGGRKFVRVGK